MVIVSMLLSALCVGAASGLTIMPEARLLFQKSQMDDVPEERTASHDVFNATLAMKLVNSTGFQEDPYKLENWWKDASRNHQPAKNLRGRWKKALKNEPSKFVPVDDTHERRIIFLFLVTESGIYHPDLWNAFFEDGKPSQFSAYVHCTNYCNQTMLKRMPLLKPVDIVPTHYCHNLVDAMVSLLKGAIADGGTPNDKFIFVSDSTLPVKPFNEVYHVLGKTTDSDMCVFPIDHWGEAAFNNKRAVLVKHHQWVILNYEHAQVMVQTWGSVDSQGQWSVPIRTPTYSEPLIYNAEKFSRAPIANWCADEWAFFATIFGAIPDNGSASTKISGYRDRNGGNTLMLNGPGTTKMQGTCRTFAFWSDVDPDAAKLAAQLAKGHPHNVLSCWPSCTYRPAEVEKLSNDGLLQMRRSPFLFARKFSNTIKLPQFRDIILKNDSPSRVGRPGLKVNVSDWDLIHDGDDEVDYEGTSKDHEDKSKAEDSSALANAAKSSTASAAEEDEEKRLPEGQKRNRKGKTHRDGTQKEKVKRGNENEAKAERKRLHNTRSSQKSADEKSSRKSKPSADANMSDWDLSQQINDAFGDSYR